MAAGGIGATVGNPTDLILIRMQADSLLPEAKRRNYSSFFNAAKRIPAEEGLLALWTGTQPTIARAMAVNVGQLSVSEEAKERYSAALPNNPRLAWILAILTASAAVALISLPFDNAKTKM